MKATVRMLPPPSPSAMDPLATGGRSYRSNGALFVDFYAPDADVAANNGWQTLGLVGATSDRPTPNDWDSAALLQPGVRFIDLTLGRALQWDSVANLWRDAVTGAVS